MSLDDDLAALGVIPTVYSFVYPETRAAFDAVRGRADLPEMYERAWTRHQDPMHHALIDGWLSWAKPVVQCDGDRFVHRYVAAGSSEAIRDNIALHAARSFQRGQPPRIHIFSGEYEGYAAYAAAHHCEVVRHRREDYRPSLAAQSRPGDRFYLSAPSALDGMVWSGYDEFLAFVARELPDLGVAVDLCYVGCVGGGAYRISVDSPVVDTVFFSLSKVFGVYYHRIGGVLMTEPSPGLFGNVWFKNLLSINLGVELMQRHDVFELPRRYRQHQEQICGELGALCGPGVEPADVVLLARQPGGDADDRGRHLDQRFARGTQTRRYCLTPALDRKIKGAGD